MISSLDGKAREQEGRNAMPTNNSNSSANNQLPSIEMPIYSTIPEPLAQYDQWVCWGWSDDDAPRKRIRISDLLPVQRAYQMAMENDYGLAFWLTDDDPFAVISMPQKYSHEIDDISIKLDSYTEVLACDDTDIDDFQIIVSTSYKPIFYNATFELGSVLFRDAMIPITGHCISEPAIQIRQAHLEQLIFNRTITQLTDYADLATNNTDSPKTALHQILAHLFKSAAWHHDSDKTGLFPFLARIWAHTDLRLMVHQKIQLEKWSRQHRDDFFRCITDLLPKPEKPEIRQAVAVDEKTKALLELDDLIQVDRQGRAKETFFNMSMILQHHEHWEHRLRFDVFRNVAVLDGDPVGDMTEYRIAEWLGRNYQFGCNNHKSVARAICAAGSVDQFDSLHEWLSTLPEWDKTPRLRTWMRELCGSPNDTYTEWVSFVTIMQMMARAITPGCRARLVPIWEGPENRGKSTAISILGGQWYSTLKISMESKESQMAIQGYWLVELEELDTMYRTSEYRLKAFISNTSDHFVPKYSNHAVTYPRRTVFIGTTNDAQYLKGETGNTRFLPIKVGDFDEDGLISTRLQLFSEAYSILKEHPDTRWWEEPESLRDRIASEREARREINVYADELRQWADGTGPYVDGRYWSELTWRDVALHFLKIDTPERWKDKSLQMAVAAGLRAIGFERVRDSKNSFWRRTPAEDDSVPF